MSKVQMLRCLVNQRLTAAAEEIFSLFERTIAEYEEERRELLQTRADVQQLLVLKEAVPPERQEWGSGLDQEDPEPPHIKEEQVELSIQEGEQLQGQEEVNVNFPFTLVTVKTEEDVDERDQSSRLHGSHTEENREAELLKTDEDDCGGSESASNSDPDGPFHPATHDENSSSSEYDDNDETSSSSESETDDETSSSSESETDDETSSSSESETDDETSSSSESETDVSGSDWEETGEPPSGPNPLQNNAVPVNDDECNTGCVEGARSVGHEGRLQKLSPVGVHSDGKRFSGPVCGKKFTLNQHMKRHLALHTGEKPFSCSDCSRRFTQQGSLTRHMTSHTGEKPFSCSFCGKGFLHRGNLKQHLTSHTGGKPFSCSECGRGFAQKELLKQHLVVHAGEKPFGCSVCCKRFTQNGSLKRHLTAHRRGTISVKYVH